MNKFNIHLQIILQIGILCFHEIHIIYSDVMEFKLESPGGLIGIIAKCINGRVKSVTMRSMPSFVGFQQKFLSHPKINQALNVNGM